MAGDSAPTTPDEFRHGIWWRPVSNGTLRPATGQECAAEIQRLRAVVAGLLAENTTLMKRAIAKCNSVPKVENWRLCPDRHSPALIVACENNDQRVRIMAALRYEPDASETELAEARAEIERLRAVIARARTELATAPDVDAAKATRAEMALVMAAQHAAWTALAGVPERVTEVDNGRGVQRLGDEVCTHHGHTEDASCSWP